MKKRVTAVVFLLCFALMLTACTKKDDTSSSVDSSSSQESSQEVSREESSEESSKADSQVSSEVSAEESSQAESSLPDISDESSSQESVPSGDTVVPDETFQNVGAVYYKLTDGWTEQDSSTPNARRYSKTAGNSQISFAVEGDTGYGGTDITALYNQFESMMQSSIGQWASKEEVTKAGIVWQHYQFAEGSVSGLSSMVADCYLYTDGDNIAYYEFGTTSDQAQAMAAEEEAILSQTAIIPPDTTSEKTDPNTRETIGHLSFQLQDVWNRQTSDQYNTYTLLNDSGSYALVVQYTDGLAASGFDAQSAMALMESTIESNIGVWSSKTSETYASLPFTHIGYSAGTFESAPSMVVDVYLYTDGDILVYFQFESAGATESLAALEEAVLSSIQIAE